MNEKGYQIIEPDQLQGLVADPQHLAIAVAILSWLRERLCLELKEQLGGAEIDVICVTYLGSYPALGVHDQDRNPHDLAPVIEPAIDRLLGETPLVEFVNFVQASGKSWSEEATRLIDRGSTRLT